MFIESKKVEREMRSLVNENEQHARKSESGNVLFLILIAVALFAALSYAVTQSSRSGGGDASSETNLVNSSSITQYPASVRTSIIRMQVSNGVDVTDMEFNIPSDFGNCSDSGANCVFHPSGGGATYMPGPAEVMDSGSQGRWYFNAENEIENVGVDSATEDSPTTSSAEVIAFLPDIKKGICKKINDELGITSASVDDIPIESGVNVQTTNHENADGSSSGLPNYVASGTTATINGTGGELVGQAFGCFQQPAGTFHYYHVLIEQ